MKVIFVFLICLGFGSTSQADKGRTFHRQMSNDSKPRMILDLASFSWENCGKEDAPAGIKALSLQPDPMRIPGELKASGTGFTTVNLTAPLMVKVDMEMKLLGMWVNVPCIHQIGSCVYEDACDVLNHLFPPDQPCPEQLAKYGLPCHCPIKAGEYTLPKSTFFLSPDIFPIVVISGKYRLKGLLMKHQQELACLKVSFAFKTY